MSPTSEFERSTAPLFASTPIAPRTLANGYRVADATEQTDRDDERDANDNRTSADIDSTDNRCSTNIDSVDNRISTIADRVDNRSRANVHKIDKRSSTNEDTLSNRNSTNVGDVNSRGASVNKEIDNVDNRLGSLESRIDANRRVDSLDDVENRISGDKVKRFGRRIDDYDSVNGNVNVNIVSESTTSMDVLSGGESDAGDTLSRRNNNNSIASGIGAGARRRGADVTYYVARELLMTERTYKRDLDLVTVSWSARVGRLGRLGSSGAQAAALARGCLALEPLALPAGALLARLDRALAATHAHAHAQLQQQRSDDPEEPDYKKIADMLYDYLSSTFDAYAQYTASAGALVALVESARRRGGAAAREAGAFDAGAPLPLACLLLRPLHRLLHYRRLAHELWSCAGGESARGAHELAERAARAAAAELDHVENHAALCQLQRDIVGYDKLLVAGREFIRLGCLYKHSSKGLQQRMLFLFSDLLLITSKCASGQFRAHSALPLHRLALQETDLPNSIAILADDEATSVLLSASTEAECAAWRASLAAALLRARHHARDDARVDADLAPADADGAEASEGGSAGGAAGAGGALAAVCWHRVASMSRARLHAAMRSQLSGYLLRKFKNSHGWQKLWVVFAAFTLFFYKSWQDDAPLASLPLLGYSVGPPAEGDGIGKEFVFKLQFKNHVYFFRADSHFTYNRWIEVLQMPMQQHDQN